MEHTDLSQNVADRVIRVISEYRHSAPGIVRPDSTFAELGIDSLDGLQLIFALEEEFNLNIPDDVARGFTSVQQAVDAILGELGRKTAPAVQA